MEHQERAEGEQGLKEGANPTPPCRKQPAPLNTARLPGLITAIRGKLRGSDPKHGGVGFKNRSPLPEKAPLRVGSFRPSPGPGRGAPPARQAPSSAAPAARSPLLGPGTPRMVPLRRRPPLPAPAPGGSLLRFALTGARAALAPPLRPHQLSPAKPTPAPPPPPDRPLRPVPSRPRRCFAPSPASLSVYFQRRKRRKAAKMAAGGGPTSPQRPRPRRLRARAGAGSSSRPCAPRLGAGRVPPRVGGEPCRLDT